MYFVIAWPCNTSSGTVFTRLSAAPRLSAAYESKNIKERHPRISAAFIHNNAAPNRSIISLNQC